MANYGNFAMEIRDDQIQLSGMNQKWKQEMILSKERHILQKIREKEQRVVVVHPVRANEKERTAWRNRIQSMGLEIRQELSAPEAIASFYTKQKRLVPEDHEILVIDTYDSFTEISCLEFNGRGGWKVSESIRVIYGVRCVARNLANNASNPQKKPSNVSSRNIDETMVQSMLKDSFMHRMFGIPFRKEVLSYRESEVSDQQSVVITPYLLERALDYPMNQISDSVQRMIQRNIHKNHGQKPVKIFCSGVLWECSMAVDMIKTLIPNGKVHVYKPQSAAVLGGCLYREIGKAYKWDGILDIDDKDVLYQAGKTMGNISRLNQNMQRTYRNVLEGVLQNKEIMTLPVTSSELRDIYFALETDYPDLEFRWDYMESSYTPVTMDGKLAMKLYLKYKEKGSLLKRLDRKSDEIIEAALKNRQLSDEEMVRAIYLYMSEQYHYTRERTKDGEFPEHAYTLEALLKGGVCRGYAVSFVYILRKLQIPILYIEGEADGNEFGGHAWNLIQMTDGTFKHIDLTWDMGKGRSEKELCYMGLDDIAMKARKHFWNPYHYPICQE